MRRALWSTLLSALLVAAPASASAEVGAGDQRIALSSFYIPLTGQSDASGVWAGFVFGYSFISDWVTLLVASGYTANGSKPGQGRQGLAPLAGLEVAVPVHPWVSPFVRAMGGPIVELTDSQYKQYDLVSAMVTAQLGARFRYFEVFGAAGVGPGSGANIGFGISFVLPFGTAPGGGSGEADRAGAGATDGTLL
jgi:hypothetical protein